MRVALAVSGTLYLTFCGLLFSGSVSAATTILQPYQWQLISFPGEPTGTVGEMFNDVLPSDELGITWALYTHDADSNAYTQLAASERITSSNAFWIMQITDQAVSFDLSTMVNPTATQQSDACSSDNSCVEHPLAPSAWTLVGSPFTEDLTIDNIRLMAPGTICEQSCSLSDAAFAELVTGVFYSYNEDTASYEQFADGDALKPGVGYWFANSLPSNSNGAALLLPSPTIDSNAPSVFTKAALLGRGINLGNALEAPEEGLWGLTLEAYYFDRVADAGFDSIRVPIKWSAHAMQTTPYTIDPQFFERVDWVLEQSQRTDLAVVLNIHHYEALMASPAAEFERYLSMWNQIASRYSNAPDNVFFELLNEPTEVFDDNPSLWNQYLAAAVDQIRATNPDRALIVGPVGWNAITRLPELVLPNDDQLITTVHFYSPFEFTHQGASWVNSDLPTGVSFDPSVMAIGGAYQNWSWDTTVVLENNSLSASFVRQYAGLNFRLMATDTPTQLNVTIRNNTDVQVGCGTDGEFTFVDEINHNSTTSQAYSINLSACGSGVQTVVLQNRTVGASEFIMDEGEICSATQCNALFETAGDAIRSELQQAVQYGIQSNTPIYLGEFGAYELADMASRAQWTQVVQDSAMALGMTSAYWEFGSGFGAFDISNDQWFIPLHDALLP